MDPKMPNFFELCVLILKMYRQEHGFSALYVYLLYEGMHENVIVLFILEVV
jgi:hypothetical protein